MLRHVEAIFSMRLVLIWYGCDQLISIWTADWPRHSIKSFTRSRFTKRQSVCALLKQSVIARSDARCRLFTMHAALWG